MRLIILGSGCARGTPKVGCNCATCSSASHDKRLRRTRFGILVQTGSGNLLIDAGPDLRAQLLEASGHHNVLPIEHVLVTHSHYDHVGGMGDLSALVTQCPIQVHGVGISTMLKQIGFEYLVKAGSAQPIEQAVYTPFRVGSLQCTPIGLKHSVPTVGYVLESPRGKRIAICTDTSLDIPNRSIELLKGCTLLIVDALADSLNTAQRAVREISYRRGSVEYSHVKFGHLLLTEAQQLASWLNADMTVAVHISHLCPDHDALSRQFGSSSFRVGYDSMVIEIDKSIIVR
jgi:phosphoribosyl 1,2-cyclic phosphate phosphodiesterase